MTINGEHHFLRRNMQLLRRCIDDALVGLVRNQPVDVIRRRTRRLKRIDDDIR